MKELPRCGRPAEAKNRVCSEDRVSVTYSEAFGRVCFSNAETFRTCPTTHANAGAVPSEEQLIRVLVCAGRESHSG